MNVQETCRNVPDLKKSTTEASEILRQGQSCHADMKLNTLSEPNRFFTILALKSPFDIIYFISDISLVNYNI
jgi:hypothetical protein